MQKLLLGLNELIWVKHVTRGQEIFAMTVVRRAPALSLPLCLPPRSKPGAHVLASEIRQWPSV